MKKLSRLAKGFYRKNRKYILDIILYGSVARGKHNPRDIDIMLLLKTAYKKKYFDIPYEFSKALENAGMKADVKGILLE